MALTGAHVVCGYVTDVRGARLLKPVWSETIALGGQTTQRAPSLAAGNTAALVFRVRAPTSSEIYAAVGAAPDASQAIGSTSATAREHLIVNQEKDIPASDGDKVAVVAA